MDEKWTRTYPAYNAPKPSVRITTIIPWNMFLYRTADVAEIAAEAEPAAATLAAPAPAPAPAAAMPCTWMRRCTISSGYTAVCAAAPATRGHPFTHATSLKPL